ncbi:ribonuclease H [Trifolium pratense]|uniref:Ribonuclease H n=1 Tax=Trifolium pratense TaxID=57577 RepID=A0A2K3K3I8_TRIPR|nr:ribonuclease H [Trifolium pratense]
MYPDSSVSFSNRVLYRGEIFTRILWLPEKWFILCVKGYFAIKVDLSKAYDKLNWEFVWRIIMELKLPERMVNVIKHSITSVETNVKWNSACADYFWPQRGIRQGDPMSPYLFVLCIDKLSHAVEEGDWKANQLSLAGRVTLAKSVLEAIPIYPMMMTNVIHNTNLVLMKSIRCRGVSFGETQKLREDIML